MRKSSDNWLILRKNDSASMTQIVEANIKQSRLRQKFLQLPVGAVRGHRRFWPRRIVKNPGGERFALSFPQQFRCGRRQDDFPCSCIGLGIPRYQPAAPVMAMEYSYYNFTVCFYKRLGTSSFLALSRENILCYLLLIGFGQLQKSASVQIGRAHV